MQQKYNSKGMKSLKEWMRDNKITKVELTKMLQCYWAGVWFISTGRRLPSLEIAIELEKISKGKVKCTSWVIPVSDANEEKSKNRNHKQKQNKKQNTDSNQPQRTRRINLS